MPFRCHEGRSSTNKKALERELCRPPIISGVGPYYADIGMIVVACGIGFAALIASKGMQPQIATANVPLPQAYPAKKEMPLKPLSLEELLQELRKRLAQENVATNVDSIEGKIRLISNAPLFAFSQPNLDRAHEADARKIAEALAWAARCHIDFQDQQFAAPEPRAQVCKLTKGTATQTFDYCLQNRGRVSITHIRFEGHADSVPFRPHSTAEFADNQSLSNARATRFADSVVTCAKSDLKARGSAATIPYEALGMGSNQPAERTGRDPRNRRIEVRFKTDGHHTQSVQIE